MYDITIFENGTPKETFRNLTFVQVQEIQRFLNRRGIVHEARLLETHHAPEDVRFAIGAAVEALEEWSLRLTVTEEK